jgi:hypothetical protein
MVYYTEKWGRSPRQTGDAHIPGMHDMIVSGRMRNGQGAIHDRDLTLHGLKSCCILQDAWYNVGKGTEDYSVFLKYLRHA